MVVVIILHFPFCFVFAPSSVSSSLRGHALVPIGQNLLVLLVSIIGIGILGSLRFCSVSKVSLLSCYLDRRFVLNLHHLCPRVSSHVFMISNLACIGVLCGMLFMSRCALTFLRRHLWLDVQHALLYLFVAWLSVA